VALVAPLLALPLGAAAALGDAPLRAVVDQRALLFTGFLPRLLVGTVLFNVAEEIGWMGFLQARWQDRYGPLKACLMVTVPFTLFHLPVLAVVHLAARVVMAWLYNNTGRSVLLVGLFHSGFDAAVWYANRITPGPAGTATYVGFVIVLAAAVALVVATRGRLSYRPSPAVPPTGPPRQATAATGATPSPNRIV
jgi:membrane protease YdiL (CAAX protease family)